MSRIPGRPFGQLTQTFGRTLGRPGFIKSVRPIGQRVDIFGNVTSRGGRGGDFLSQLNQQQTAANQANEARFQEILQGRKDLQSDLLSQLEGFGESRRSEIREDAAAAEQSALANLSDRGFAGSNLDPGVRDLTQRRLNRSLGQFDEQLLGQRLNLQRGLANEIFNFQERRTDVGPDQSLILSLLSQLGGGASQLGGLF